MLIWLMTKRYNTISLISFAYFIYTTATPSWWTALWFAVYLISSVFDTPQQDLVKVMVDVEQEGKDHGFDYEVR